MGLLSLINATFFPAVSFRGPQVKKTAPKRSSAHEHTTPANVPFAGTASAVQRGSDSGGGRLAAPVG
jgi:hypothetical protein